MSEIIVCGIDPSIAGTAVCTGTGPQETSLQRFPTKKIGDDVGARIRRLEVLAELLMGHLEPIKPQVIFLEHYSFGSVHGGEYLGEWGGILRWHLVAITPHVFEVAPLTIKKFITGKGAGKKDVIAGHLGKHWGRTFANDDQADAFSLYQMALVAVGAVEARNEAQREAVAKVLDGRERELESLVMSPAF